MVRYCDIFANPIVDCCMLKEDKQEEKRSEEVPSVHAVPSPQTRRVKILEERLPRTAVAHRSDSWDWP
jgi:hypothetical protein